MGEKERIDDIGFSGFRLIQRPDWFCYGIDAVLLADYAKVKKGGLAADLGCGTGIIPLIMKHKYNPAKIYGIEVQPEVAEIAERNVELNSLKNIVEIVSASVIEAAEILEKRGVPKESFDAVATNPPYVPAGGGIRSGEPHKSIARHETVGVLEDFVSCAAKLLKTGGDFYMINRPNRLVDVVWLCRKYRLEPANIRFIQPSEGKKPNIFLIHCVKYGGSDLKFDDPLCVYKADGTYSEEVLAMYERK